MKYLRKKKLRKFDHFKPEFINRIDDIIIFNRLSKNEIRKILKLQISEIIYILKAKKINILIEESAENWLIDEGF